MRYLLLCIVLMLSTACTLNLAESPSRLPTRQAVIPATARPAATSEAQPAKTPEPLPTTSTVSTQNTASNPQPVSANCVLRNDWTITYTVVPGDSLSKIAARAGSTTSALASGNCIANPNSISVGQVLRVPRTPTSDTLPPPVVNNPPVSQVPQQGSINISSYITADAGNYFLLRGDAVTLRWDGVPASAARVTFWLWPYGWSIDRAGSNGPSLGDDFNPADGAAITWVVPGGAQGQVVAFAYRADGSVLAYSAGQSVSTAPPAGQGCEITPADAAGITAYTQADANSPKFGIIPAGQYVEVLGRSLNGWYTFDPGVAQAGTTGVARLRWLPPDSLLNYRGNCPGGSSPTVQSYSNSTLGLALQYPSSWGVVADQNYVDFKGPDGSVFEITYGLPTTPRAPADVAAECKSAFACTGTRTILSESSITLASGIPGYRINLSGTADGASGPTVYVFVSVGGREMVLRGFGDLGKFEMILNSFRAL
jgi:LysM repeat protein